MLKPKSVDTRRKTARIYLSFVLYKRDRNFSSQMWRNQSYTALVGKHVLQNKQLKPLKKLSVLIAKGCDEILITKMLLQKHPLPVSLSFAYDFRSQNFQEMEQNQINPRL